MQAFQHSVQTNSSTLDPDLCPLSGELSALRYGKVPILSILRDDLCWWGRGCLCGATGGGSGGWVVRFSECIARIDKHTIRENFYLE